MKMIYVLVVVVMLAFFTVACGENPVSAPKAEEIEPDPAASISSPPQPKTGAVEGSKEENAMKQSAMEEEIFPSGSLLRAVDENNYAEVVKILDSDAIDIDEMNAKGETPLLIAVHNNTIEIAKVLLLAGGDINKQDEMQDSPYLYAGAEGRTEILAFMLEHASPDYSVTNRYGGNALIPAAEKGHIEAVKILLEDGREDIDHINDLGYTALLEAVALTDGSKTYQEIVSLLLAYGADASIKDDQGLTALDYAERKNYVEIAQIIRRYSK